MIVRLCVLLALGACSGGAGDPTAGGTAGTDATGPSTTGASTTGASTTGVPATGTPATGTPATGTHATGAGVSAFPAVPAEDHVAPTNGLPDPTVAPPAIAPGPAELTPPVPAFEMGMMDHATVLGWSADGTEFGYCNDGMSLHCRFVKADGTEEELRDRDSGGDEADPARAAAIQARIARMNYGAAPGAWPYASALALTWEVVLGDGAKIPSTLRVGARVAGRGGAAAEAPVYPIEIVEPGFDRMHPELIALSPDGTKLGVVSHAFLGEYSDTFRVRVMDTRVLAGRAYNGAGMVHHLAGEYTRAATLFHAAAYADPTSPVALYNLACASARAGSPSVRTALRMAVTQGGDATRTKAQADADLASVRAEPWFIAMTTVAAN